MFNASIDLEFTLNQNNVEKIMWYLGPRGLLIKLISVKPTNVTLKIHIIV